MLGWGLSIGARWWIIISQQCQPANPDVATYGKQLKNDPKSPINLGPESIFGLF